MSLVSFFADPVYAYAAVHHNFGTTKSPVRSASSKPLNPFLISAHLKFDRNGENNKGNIKKSVVSTSSTTGLNTHDPSGNRTVLKEGANEKLVLELKPSNASLLTRYASQVDIKGSPYYHKYLSSKEILAKFSPAQKIVSVVEDLLLRHGFHINKLPADKLLIPFDGTRKQVNTYFGSGPADTLGIRLRNGEAPSGTHSIPNLIGPAPGLPVFLRPYAMGVLRQSSLSKVPQLQHPSLVVAHATQSRANAVHVAPKNSMGNWLSLAGVSGINKSLQNLFSMTSRKSGTATNSFKLNAHSASSMENPVFSNPLAPHACPAALSDAVKTKGWTINAIANAYGLGGLYGQGDLGQGETIAVFELEPFLRSDLASFEKCYFGHSFLGHVSQVKVAGFSLRGAGSGEAILDIELLSALAPEAHLLVYESPNTAAGVLQAYNDMVIQDKANIATTSWGECEAAMQASAPGAEQLENFIFEEAAVEGISLFAATGDDGADDCASTPYGTTTKAAPYLSVDDPASQPFVVGVGGTTMLTASNPPIQAVWNNGPAGGGGGGGVSTVWKAPSWQASAQLQGNLKNSNREVPDISMSANEDYGVTVYSRTAYGFGYIKTKHKVFLHSNAVPSGGRAKKNNVAQQQHVIVLRHHGNGLLGGWTSVGGTSEAAPIMAASAALVASSAACDGLPVTKGGPDIGFLSPLLYELASNPLTASQSFNQITSGNNDVFHDGKGYQAGPGYNLVTGLGSPILTNSGGSPAFASDLCGLALGKTGVASSGSSGVGAVTVSSLAPDTGSTSGNETVNVGGTGFGTSPTALSVYFGAVKAQIISVTNNQITVVAPASPVYKSSASFAGAGEVTVTVTKLTGQTMQVSPPGKASLFDYVYFAANAGSGSSSLGVSSSGIANNHVKPTVTYIAPTGGRKSGGTRVTIFGNGFREGGGIKAVLFGGRKARSYRVVSDRELVAITPAMTGGTKCKRGKNFTPATVCQAEVRVIDAAGKSPLSVIRPPVVGNIAIAPGGYDKVIKGREVTPATTEFDYAEPPFIASALVSDQIDSTNIPLTITGKNFNVLTLEWVNVGNPKVAANEQTKFEYITGNLIIVITSVLPNSVVSSPGSKEISIQGVAGMSNPAALQQVNGN